MPNHAGPNTNESGLVFSFDVNDYNSFKGQPGTNLGSGPNFGYSSSGYTEYQNGKLIRWKSTTEKVHIPTLGVKNVNTIEWYNVYSGYGVDGNYTCCPTIFTYSPNGWNSTILEPSTEYMYQIIYKSASGYTHPNYMYHYERSADDSQGTEFGVHSTGRRTHLGDGWYHAWGSFTTQSYTVKGYFGCWHYEYNTKNKVSLAAVSLVKGNTVRPPAQFIDEGVTLGNTEALLDLTGNTTIDLSNVSFDANAQVDYDGSSNYVSLGSSLNSIGSNATFEMVFKAEELTDNYRVMLGWGYGNSNYSGIHIGSWTSGLADESLHINFNAATLTYHIRKGHTYYKDNQYHHLIVTAGPGNYGVWVDGVQEDIYFQYGSQLTSFDKLIGYNENIVAEIGRRPYGSGTGYFNGKLPLMKIYNRILTASEIKANYNAVKSRFNI